MTLGKRLGPSVIAIIIACSFNSCKKWIEKWLPGHGHGNTDTAATNFRISKLSFTYNGSAEGPRQSGLVFYNQQNNPDSILFDGVLSDSIGDPSILRALRFGYNSNKQLTSTTLIGSGNFLITHTYLYDGSGRISTDSARIIQTDPIGYVIYSKYDQQDRIYEQIVSAYESGGQIYPTPIIYTYKYAYDSAGNLKRQYRNGDAVTYDNKVSYMRTNKIWMFLSNNYSKNNPDNAFGYTSFGLPTGFRSSIEYSFLTFGDPYSIEYEYIGD